jgi:hypothetical protein
MSAFSFRLEHPDCDPMERTRLLDDEAQAIAYGEQLLKDWPDCALVDVVSDGHLLSRLRRRPS